MAKSANQKLKLLYIMDKFIKDTDEEHGITTQELTEYLAGYDISVERKTIYDDIETLRIYGMDILKEKVGKQTYYKLISREFELPELKLLVDSVQAAKFITANKTNELIKKLESLASKYEARELQRQVHVLNRVKNPNEKIYFSVDTLHRAIYKNVQVTFKYTYWNLKKELVPKHDGKIYHVSPWALTWDDENYYLIGYDEDEAKIKHFRVDKMDSLSETSEARHGKEHFDKFDLASYSKKVFGMYGGEEKTVKLRAKSHMVGVIIDRFGKDIMIIPEKESGGEGEYFTVNVDVAVSNQFIGWIIGLGSDVEIVSPPEVRSQVNEYLTSLSKIYSN
ncbi:MAG: WYL domain-containing protein [Lachnospiraceae bacterium]|nr:WYL domain-containing protein [Lachnospiraceae bacterium]